MMAPIFVDRAEAGRRLAEVLDGLGPGVLVRGVARGGVTVAAQVARALGAPLGVLVVRKLGVPGHEELAMGALASDGVVVPNPDLAGLRVAGHEVEAVVRRELAELERRERVYRRGRAAPDLVGRTVAVVDDGLATGTSMLAALRALRRQGAGRLLVAVPVAPAGTCAALEREAEQVVCLATPEPFGSVGQWYADFHAVGDDEVRDALAGAGSGDDE